MKYNPLPQVLEGLKELSDKEFQLHAWTGKTPGLQSSLVEATEGLYSDSGYSIALDENGTVFGQKIDSLLRDLAKAISIVEEEIYTADAINSSNMEIVRKKAEDILKLLLD